MRILEKKLDRLAFRVAMKLPKRLCYWVVVRVGSTVIGEQELVPEVPFVDVLTRWPVR